MKNALRISALTPVLATLASLTFSGCKQIEMKNGEIPASFVAQAKQAEGTYKGFLEFRDGSGIAQNLREATLTLKIEGTKPVLTSSTDFLGDECGSKIGPLLNVQVSKLKLKTVAFAFDAGSCKTSETGDRVMINVAQDKTTQKFSLESWVMVGTATIDAPAGMVDENGVPQTETTSSTLSKGRFKQQ